MSALLWHALEASAITSLIWAVVWVRYVRSERSRLRGIASRFGVTLPDDEAPTGDPLCVACGSPVEEGLEILWGYGPLDKHGVPVEGEVPGLMRSLNLCDECGYRVAKEIA